MSTKHPSLGTVRSMAELDSWHAQTREAALEPELPIIDAHHHMWIRPPERYGLEELIGEMSSGHNVVATVFMECFAMFRADGPELMKPLGETEWVNGVAAESASGLYGDKRLCAGIVSFADLTQGAAVREVLEAHVRAAGDRFRGIRYQAQHDATIGSLARRSPPGGLLRDKTFREGFAQLAPLGLSFDAYLFHPQLDDVLDLARAFPEATIILNHVGGPLGVGPYAGRREEVFGQWAASVTRVAQAPNVYVKIGGLGMAVCGFGFHERPMPPSSEELAEAWRPYVETCIEAFGPSRAMLESNFPVDKQSCSYVPLWNAFKRLTCAYSASERAALFHDTAQRVYRLHAAPI